MKLHHIISSPEQKEKKRIARGGKRGTTSGRGTKGQKSRAGHRIRPAERDIILRIPKKRGFRNKPTSEKPIVIRLSVLAQLIKPYIEKEKNTIVNPKLLLELGYLRDTKKQVKILDGGTINYAMSLEGIAVSKGARIKIEKAGGKII